jgi:hypothetical protein
MIANNSKQMAVRAFPKPGAPFVICACCGHAIVGVTKREPGDRWTRAQDEFLVSARSRGATLKQIAWTLGVEPGSVAVRFSLLRPSK